MKRNAERERRQHLENLVRTAKGAVALAKSKHQHPGDPVLFTREARLGHALLKDKRPAPSPPVALTPYENALMHSTGLNSFHKKENAARTTSELNLRTSSVNRARLAAAGV